MDDTDSEYICQLNNKKANQKKRFANFHQSPIYIVYDALICDGVLLLRHRVLFQTYNPGIYNSYFDIIFTVLILPTLYQPKIYRRSDQPLALQNLIEVLYLTSKIKLELDSSSK